MRNRAILLASCMAAPWIPCEAVAQSTETGSAIEATSTVDAAVSDSEKSVFDEDIVVTANRREERLQRVPIAVTAVTASQLSVSGITSNALLAEKVPALQVTYTGGAVLPYIRGIGSNNPSPGDEAPVATYIDGVYQSRSYATNFSGRVRQGGVISAVAVGHRQAALAVMCRG